MNGKAAKPSTTKSPFGSIVYKAEQLTPEDLQRQQREAEASDASEAGRPEVKQELAEDQTATADYRERMGETTGPG